MKLVRVPRLGDVIFIFIMLACLLLGQRMLNVDSDLGRHLTVGRYILESGEIPVRDILSFTRAGAPRPAYEWLSQVVFAVAERVMGLDGVVLLTAMTIAAAFLVVFIDARQRGDGALASLGLTIWAAAASSLHWLTRPHVISFLFLSTWILLLDRMRRGERGPRWQLPLVMLLWANFHGGFVFGHVAWLAYALGAIVEQRQAEPHSGVGTWVMVGVASLGASIATPGLGANWIALANNASSYVLSRTAETGRVALTTTSTWPFIGLVLFALILAIGRGRRVVVAHVLLLLGTAVLGFWIMRNIPLFCIAAVPILAGWAASDFSTNSNWHRLEARVSAIDSSVKGYLWAATALLVTTLALAARGFSTGRGLYEFDIRRFPVKAIDWISTHDSRGATFNDINWGGYMLYRLWPRDLVFIDSQTDFYQEQFIRQYATTYQASGNWRTELDRFAITRVILPPDAALSIHLMAEADWTVGFQDSTAVVLVR